MKQIFNWTIGSFFRSIGRIIAYLVIGGIIAYLVSGGDFRRFKISELFFDRLDALTLTNEVKKTGDGWLTISDSGYTDETVFYTKIITSNNNTFYLYYTPSSPIDARNHDYMTFTMLLSQPNVTYGNNPYSNVFCTQWEYYNNGGANNGYFCSDQSWEDYNLYIPNSVSSNIFNVAWRVSYTDGGWSMCTMQEQELVCPVKNKYVSEIRAIVNFRTSTSTNMKLGLSRGYNFWSNQSPTDAINHQTEVIQNTNSTPEVSEATDYFESVNDTSQDGIKAVVSMPLNIFNALTLGSTQDLCFTLKSKQTCLPSGNIIWGKTSRTQIKVGNATVTQHAFSNQDIPTGVNNFKIIFNLVVGGYLAYKMLKSLMRITTDMLSPTKDKVEVLEL